MNSRRKLIIALAALRVASSSAQPVPRAAKTMRVGMLLVSTRAAPEMENSKTFVDAMRELGWVEGSNIIYDSVYADNDESRRHALAADLTGRSPDLIWMITTAAAQAAIANTRTIPIVFASGNNVVARGLVKSLARPGGNVTGIQNFNSDLGGKRLQLLKQALPKITRVGVLVNPNPDVFWPSRVEFKEVEKAAAALGVIVFPAMAKAVLEFDAAIASLVKNRVEALLVTQSFLFQNERKRILALAASQRLPVVSTRNEFTDDGALMSYGSLLRDQIRRSAQIVDKILKGTKPADIPVEQPVKFELVVNLKAAKALGITIPGEIMLQATRVIE